MSLTDEEAKLKADAAKAESILAGDIAKAYGMVRPRMVWVAGVLGALLGFIVGHVTS